MKHKITQIDGIVLLDANLDLSESQNAPYQLEMYYTDKHPNTRVGALNNNTHKFSYKVGETIDVIPRVSVSNYTVLTNVVMNSFLQQYLRTR